MQTRPLSLDLPRPLKAALDAIASAGGHSRIVGGSVRDALLGHAPKDFDVEVYGLELNAIAATLAKIGKTDLVGKAFAVVKLWTQGEEYDFAIPRRESKTGAGHRGFAIQADPELAEQDALQRRDFTINALLYDPERQIVIDHVGGLADLESKTLRHVSPAFAEDPLRVLRGMQFAGRFGMSLHPETARLCRSIRHEFPDLAPERIWTEWEKWAAQSRFLSHGMRALQDSGWLECFPQLHALVDLPQDPEWHPEGHVWTHTLCCLDALQEHTDWNTLDKKQRVPLALAVLCHDLGKAACTKWELKRGKHRWISPGHDQVSRILATEFLDAMRAPHPIRDAVAPLVANHHVLNSAPENGPSAAALRRLAKRLNPANATQLAYVLIADHRGRPPNVSAMQTQRIAAYRRRIEELGLETEPPKPLLLGRHLIARGQKPGPAFKEVLKQAYDAQLEGRFTDTESALAWLDARSKPKQ